MKAVLCRTFGPPETLAVEEVPTPTPGPGEALVRVKAAGVNFPDALIIQNKYQIKPPLPFSPGGELAGIVEAIGAGVTRVQPGQSVIGFTGWGAFAEQALVPQDRLVPMPEGMPYEIAGSFLMTYGTCYHALKDRGQVRAGETVLVLGAAGGIGIAAIEIAKALGARVIAAASSSGKLRTCREHGADETIDYQSEDLRERLKVLAGAGVDLVCDPVGGSFSEPALRSTAWRGRYLVIGFAGGEIPKVPLNLPLLKGCSIVGVFWGDFLRREPANGARDVQELVALYRAGRIRPLVSARYALDRTVDALQALMQRKVEGKVVVVP
ncbi:MAG TPA: NADPH:quinone oxidoreductase family protein [Burkholderiaceae bacterium]|nr:NADPH:quinone oxidoreductase family protein [Burkholderiaceae bacterium]